MICRRLQITGNAKGALTALVALNPWIIGYSNRVLSEGVYTFFSLVGILILIECKDKKTLAWPLIAGLVCGFSAIIRTVGLALVGAVILDAITMKRWWALAATSFGLGLALLPQLILNLLSGGSIISTGYQDQVVGHTKSLADRAWYMAGNAVG